MYDTYEVRPGDNLQKIARYFQIPFKDLIQANQLEEIYDIPVGTVLRIPVEPSSAFEFYDIQKGDTLYSLAKKHNTTAELLAAINGLDLADYLYPGQKLLVPKEGILVYLTKPGDSIQTLASENGVNPNDFLVYNNRIYLLPEQIIAYKPRSDG